MRFGRRCRRNCYLFGDKVRHVLGLTVPFMYNLYLCVTQDHDYALVALAAVVCVFGSVLSTLLARRMLKAQGPRRAIQVALATLMMGSTVWSTHFMAMLAYDPGFDHAYEPTMTGVSFLVAILGMAMANIALVARPDAALYPLSGILFGAAVSAMHYIGMSAFLVPGQIMWAPGPLLASVILGLAFGVLSFHRVVRPATRICWLGGAILMVLSICATHFTGMSAVDIAFSPLVTVPAKVLSDALMAAMILGVMVLILLVGFASTWVELYLEGETSKLLSHASCHDPLTGLPNRMGLNHRLSQCTADMAQDETLKVAILTIDLNNFQDINDIHGHPSGDAIFVKLGARLAKVLGQGEYVARSGGDEFVAIIQGYRREQDVMAFAERLRAVLFEPVALPCGERVIVGASIGIASTINDDEGLFDLQGKSNLAVSRAKTDPDLDICRYSAALDQQQRERQQLVNDLSQACENGELSLVFQRQNELQSLTVTGFEVLLRWTHPTRGAVSPGEFIPLAEETGLIQEIGLWVLHMACIEARTWTNPYAIAVNVAPQQLVQPTFVQDVRRILDQTGLSPQRLELEVTEASIIDDEVLTLRVMSQLKDMGVRIAMDDFGTGYSSLATLQAFPYDKIKIDRSFIQDVHRNKQRAAIVRATLLLGAALDIPVLAEGVEVQEELEFLRREKCQAVQGFYFGKPLALDELRRIVMLDALQSA